MEEGKNLFDGSWSGEGKGWRLGWSGERVRIGYDDFFGIKLVVLVATEESGVHVAERRSLCLFKFYFLRTLSRLQPLL